MSLAHRSCSGRNPVISGILTALSLLPLFLSHAAAGPNAGGRLLVYTREDVACTSHWPHPPDSGVQCLDQPCAPWDPTDCAALVVQADAGHTSSRRDACAIFWVLAAFPLESCPRLRGAAFGIDYMPERLQIEATGVYAPFHIQTTGPGEAWPAPGSGLALIWEVPRTGRITELAWFVAQVGDLPTQFAVTAHPEMGYPAFADDSIPANRDPVADGVSDRYLPIMGFGGASGSNPSYGFDPGEERGACCVGCPPACLQLDTIACAAIDGVFLGDGTACDPSPCRPTGACCLGTDGECRVVSDLECGGLSGTYLGDCSNCSPENPCRVDAVRSTTWGAIKSRYRGGRGN